LFNGFLNGSTIFDFVSVAAIVDTKDGTMIFSGVLKEYVCNGEDLDRIYLEKATRRAFKSKIETHEEMYADDVILDIPDDVLMLPYKNIINFYLKFIVLEEPPGPIDIR
jgi:hypothetical protein